MSQSHDLYGYTRGGDQWPTAPCITGTSFFLWSSLGAPPIISQECVTKNRRFFICLRVRANEWFPTLPLGFQSFKSSARTSFTWVTTDWFVSPAAHIWSILTVTRLMAPKQGCLALLTQARSITLTISQLPQEHERKVLSPQNPQSVQKGEVVTHFLRFCLST